MREFPTLASQGTLQPVPIPESPRVVFQKNPLEEVIFQVRFPAILEITAQEPAAVQAVIRREYPLYSRTKTVVIPPELADALSKAGVAMPTGSAEYSFKSEDANRTISLGKDFVAVSEKKYVQWAQFYNAVKLTLDVLEQTYQPTFYSRVGLRYQDIIDREALGLGRTPWHDLINVKLLGELGVEEIRESVQEISTVSLLAIDSVVGGAVRIRHGLKATSKSEKNNTVYAFDADFFTQERSSRNDVERILAEFNKLSGNLWRWAITQRLHDALEPEPLD